jgi:hypothetical protein
MSQSSNEHRLRTANPVEPAFATVRLRTKITKGHGPQAAGLAMAFKLIESAQRRWRMVQRTAPGRARPGRRGLRQRHARRAARRGRLKIPAARR